jgi:hypothetical protein
VVLVLAGTAAPGRHPAARSRPGTLVESFVRGTVAMQVLAMEQAVAAAEQHVQSYRKDQVNGADLAAALDQQQFILTRASQALTVLQPPAVGPQPMLQLARMEEDLALFGVELAGLLAETARTVAQTVMPQATEGLDYEQRVRLALGILRRAEGWLITVDQETGASARLPGFESSRSLEAQLGLP